MLFSITYCIKSGKLLLLFVMYYHIISYYACIFVAIWIKYLAIMYIKVLDLDIPVLAVVRIVSEMT